VNAAVYGKINKGKLSRGRPGRHSETGAPSSRPNEMHCTSESPLTVAEMTWTTLQYSTDASRC